MDIFNQPHMKHLLGMFPDDESRDDAMAQIDADVKAFQDKFNLRPVACNPATRKEIEGGANV